MYPSFIPLLSRLSRDPEAAWTFWRLLNDLSDALWEMHQDEFRQRFAEEWQDEEWPVPDDSSPDEQWPDPAGQCPEAPTAASAGGDGEALPAGRSSSQPEPDHMSSGDQRVSINDDDIPF